MANILLTTQCNRSCPYCFARSELAKPTADTLLSWENLIYIADFLKSSGQRHVSLLGGEPTTHPECVDFILYLVERNFHVTIFTNGMLPPSRLEEFRRHLTTVNNERLSFVCNLNDPLQTPASKEERERVLAFLSLMGPWTTPGFNIYRLDYQLDFLFDYINQYGLKRHMRLGVTHPVPGKEGDFIDPSDMRRVVERLCSYRPRFEALRVSPGLDCGFPICRFTDEELGWLNRFKVRPRFGCGPAVDISPDMSVYFCFPLSNYQRRSLFEFDSLREVDEHFARLRDQIKSEIAGIYEECDGCRYQDDGVCGGGGLCQVVNRFTGEANIRIREIEDELSKDRLPQ